MKYRNLRQKSTGRWVDVLLTCTEDFRIPIKNHLEQLASCTTISASDLEVIESDSDRRTGTLIAQRPVPNVAPEQTLEARIAELEARLAAIK